MAVQPTDLFLFIPPGLEQRCQLFAHFVMQIIYFIEGNFAKAEK